MVKSILHLLEAVCWTHERLVFQTTVLVQCGAKNRASFDDICGANGPKVVRPNSFVVVLRGSR